jgi:hypothetical protein
MLYVAAVGDAENDRQVSRNALFSQKYHTNYLVYCTTLCLLQLPPSVHHGLRLDYTVNPKIHHSTAMGRADIGVWVHGAITRTCTAHNFDTAFERHKEALS